MEGGFGGLFQKVINGDGGEAHGGGIWLEENLTEREERKVLGEGK